MKAPAAAAADTGAANSGRRAGQSGPDGTGTPGQRRLEGLDAFRGCLIALRILVGSQVAAIAAPFMLHAHGFGLTVADLVFPGFLFIMGLTIPVSMSAFLRPPVSPGGWDRPGYLVRIARRAALLYGAGMFLGAYPFLPEILEHLRFVGVLQRLGIVYLVVAVLYITCAWSVLPAEPTGAGACRPRPWSGGLGRLLARVLLLGGFPFLCVSVWIVATYTFRSPWPECAEVSGLVPDCSLQAYVDTGVWGAGHNFDGGRFDPEGLVSTLVAVVNCWAGAVIGMDVVRNKAGYKAAGPVRRRVRVLGCVGAVCVGAGLVLSRVIPIGKQLWTPSYALVTVGIMTAGFALVLLAFDGGLWPRRLERPPALATAWGVRRWVSGGGGLGGMLSRGAAPVGDTLVALGRNPLFFYMLSELVITTLDYIPVRYHGREGSLWSVGAEAGLAPWLGGPLAAMMWALLWLLLFYAPLARLLVARGWYLRV
ncbi:hypothetical protein [Streptomyces vinaceus]|uniref:hypothetical protein n=1 Tax=Streptomyces vinaceus TaxID=1960 RepID=UPI0038149358